MVTYETARKKQREKATKAKQRREENKRQKTKNLNQNLNSNSEMLPFTVTPPDINKLSDLKLIGQVNENNSATVDIPLNDDSETEIVLEEEEDINPKRVVSKKKTKKPIKYTAAENKNFQFIRQQAQRAIKKESNVLKMNAVPPSSRRNIIDNFENAGANVRKQKAQRLLENTQLGEFKVKPKTWFELMRDYLKPLMPKDVKASAYTKTISSVASLLLYVWLKIEKVTEAEETKVKKFIKHYPKVRQEILSTLYRIKHKPDIMAHLQWVLGNYAQENPDETKCRYICGLILKEAAETFDDTPNAYKHHRKLYNEYTPQTSITKKSDTKPQALKDQTNAMKKQYSAAKMNKISTKAKNALKDDQGRFTTKRKIAGQKAASSIKRVNGKSSK